MQLTELALFRPWKTPQGSKNLRSAENAVVPGTEDQLYNAR